MKLAAQQAPYLLLQGPTERTTMRFQLGDVLEFWLVGEDESFTARINALYPEAQAVRIDDYILSMDQIASIRYEKPGSGFRRYLMGQGITNLVIIGVAYLASRPVRQNQQSFVIGSSFFSTAMVVIGSTGRRKRRNFSSGSKYLLSVGGGDLRLSDDPNRG